MLALDDTRISRVFDRDVLSRHLAARLAQAAVAVDPMPYVVITDVFPPETYRLLLDAIPPVEAFSAVDRGKQNYTPSDTRDVWARLDVDWGACLVPIVEPFFRAPLVARYGSLLGSEHAAAAADEQVVRLGRLMLRRPGYRLAPHRDPLASAVTVLIYLTQRGEGPRCGTQLYRVRDDGWPDRSKPHYPDPASCDFVVEVPFEPNTALVFLNSLGGAHAAQIPADAPASMERYSYQTYIGMPTSRLADLLPRLPAAASERWGTKYLAR
jgi:hypothetical protein